MRLRVVLTLAVPVASPWTLAVRVPFRWVSSLGRTLSFLSGVPTVISIVFFWRSTRRVASGSPGNIAVTLFAGTASSSFIPWNIDSVDIGEQLSVKEHNKRSIIVRGDFDRHCTANFSLGFYTQVSTTCFFRFNGLSDILSSFAVVSGASVVGFLWQATFTAAAVPPLSILNTDVMWLSCDTNHVKFTHWRLSVVLSLVHFLRVGTVRVVKVDGERRASHVIGSGSVDCKLIVIGSVENR